MPNKTRVMTIRGSEIDFHASWLLVLPLIVVALALLYFPEVVVAESAVYWQLALVSGLVIFLSVLLHELGHLVRANMFGIHAKRSTLFIFGSVAEFSQEPDSAAKTFHIAVAGPLASITIGILLLAGWLFSRPLDWLAAALLLLAIFNLGLGVLNLLPVYPLDGGQMLRALLWRFRGRTELNVNNLAFLGELTGAGLMGVGVVTLLIEELLIAIWLGVVGWAIQSANIGKYIPSTLKRPLRRLGQFDGENTEAIPEEPDTADVTAALSETGAEKVLLVENGRPVGLITREELMKRLDVESEKENKTNHKKADSEK